MNAQEIFDFLKELQLDGVNLSRIDVNFRLTADNDVVRINDVSEDLFDSETNSNLESIIFTGEIEDT